MPESASRARNRSRGSQSRVSRRAVLALIDKVLDATSGHSSEDSSDSHFDSEAENIRPGHSSRYAREHSSHRHHPVDSAPRRKRRRLGHDLSDQTASRFHASGSSRKPLDHTLPSWARTDVIHELGQKIATVVGEVAPGFIAEEPEKAHELEISLAKVVAEFALSHGLGLGQRTVRDGYNGARSELNIQQADQRRASNLEFGHGATWDRSPMPHETAFGHRIEPPASAIGAQHSHRSTATEGSFPFAYDTSEGISDASEDEQPEDKRHGSSEHALQGRLDSRSLLQPSARAPWIKWPEEDTNKLRELLQKGMTIREVATHFPHRSRQAVKSRIARLENETGPSHGRRTSL